DSKVERLLRMRGQILYGLRPSIFTQLEGILGKIWDHVAVAIAHAKKDIDRGSRLLLSRGPRGLGCLSGRIEGQQQAGKDKAYDFGESVSHCVPLPAHPILPNDQLSFNSREAKLKADH